MPRGKKPKFNEEQIEKIRELSEKGYSGRNIAAIVGGSVSCVNDYRKRLGMKRDICKNARRLTKEESDKILNLSTFRYTQDEIAERCGVSKDTVRRTQQKHGIPASNRSDPSGHKIRQDYINRQIKLAKKEDEEMNKPDPVVKYETPRNSGRYPRPEETEKPVAETPIENVVSLNEKKEENTMKNILAKSDYTNILDASITISGNTTSFDYSVDIFNGILRIDAGVGVPVEIPFKSIAGFANELADVAEKVENMRKIFQSA